MQNNIVIKNINTDEVIKIFKEEEGIELTIEEAVMAILARIYDYI